MLSFAEETRQSVETPRQYRAHDFEMESLYHPPFVQLLETALFHLERLQGGSSESSGREDGGRDTRMTACGGDGCLAGGV